MPEQFRPVVFNVKVPAAALSLLPKVEAVLLNRAEAESSDCWGHYYDPDLEQDENPVYDKFSEVWPSFRYGERVYPLSWIRLGRPVSSYPASFHLDADSITGMSPEIPADNPIPADEIWRINVNLHDKVVRELYYLNVNVEDLEWRRNGGFVQLHESRELELDKERLSSLRARRGELARAARICVSRVAHSGLETGQGHFLASFARVEEAA